MKATKKKEREGRKEKVPKWSKEAFNDKLRKVKCTLENGTDMRKKYDLGKLNVYVKYKKKKLTPIVVI